MTADADASPRPYRPRAPHTTSFLMSRIRATNTRLEIELRSSLHRAGYRFRKNAVDVAGKPDIVFRRERVAVFVDGDFWHARILKEAGLDALCESLKTTNREFWVAKLRKNHERDLVVTERLEQQGWLVVRLWETDLKRDMSSGVAAIIAAVEQRRDRINESKMPVVTRSLASPVASARHTHPVPVRLQIPSAPQRRKHKSRLPRRRQQLP
jgi:DNA mismatch endonuclease, patch repair protein